MELNPGQKLAVEAEGSVRILAAPGSGKTRVITERIKHLIKNGTHPREVLAISFTRAAAQEMKKRLETDLGEVMNTMQVSTFHALAMRIVKKHGHVRGFRPGLSIYDERDSRDILSAVMKDLNIKKPGVDRVLDDLDLPKYAKVKAEYRDRVRAANALDYDMLVEEAVRLLGYNEVRSAVAIYKHVLIDEFQDVNGAQYALARAITGEGVNLCAVFDVDQCIASGTMIKTPTGPKMIDHLVAGDLVGTNEGHMFGLGFRPIVAISKRAFKGIAYHIITATGKSVRCTGDHHIPAKWQRHTRIAPSAKRCYVYISHRTDRGWRIGVTEDPDTRLHLEKRTEGLLPIACFNDRWDALAAEDIWSCKYGIPQVLFQPRGGKGEMPLEKIIHIFSQLDTKSAAENLMRDLDKSWDGFIRQRGSTRNGFSRKNIIINVLDGIYSKKTSPYRVAFESDGERIVHRTPSLHAARKYARELKLRFPTAGIHEMWHLASGERLQMVPAHNILPGIQIAVSGKMEEVVEVTTENYDGMVYDLEVRHTHNFMLDNGITMGNCIMTFQGSSLKYAMDLPEDFPGIRTLYLDTCYRCPANVLDAANRLILHNRERLDKPCRTDNPPGAIEVRSLANELEEATWIARKCQELRAAGTKYADMAVLARTHRLKNLIHDGLKNAGVPVNVCGRTQDFFRQPAVVQFLDYLRAVTNNHDSFSFRRVLNFPNRGLTYIDLLKCESTARAAGVDCLRGAELHFGKQKEVNPEIKKGLEQLRGWADRCKADPAEHKPVLNEIAAFLAEHHLSHGLTGRAGEVREAALRYDLMAFGYETIGDFLEHITELDGQDDLQEKLDEEKPDQVNLMTCHVAKGLEFEHVFVPGLEQGGFPIGSAAKDHEELEQERRLFYVAITRAKRNLYLTRSAVRSLWAGEEPQEPSVFLGELGLKDE